MELSRTASSPSRLAHARSSRWATGLLVLAPFAGLVTACVRNLDKPRGLIDFRIFRLAGRAVAHGHSPYHLHLGLLAHETVGFVYPAPAALAMVPFGVLPFPVAALGFAAITTAAIVVTLRILGVTDPRCYGVALCMMPVSTAVTTGTVSTLVTCAAAVVWRYRDRIVLPALTLAAAIMLKPVLWPVAIWLAATRRWRAALLTAATACAGTALAYAALHINGLRSYPTLVHAATTAEGARSYSLYGLLSRIGSPAPLTVAYLIGAALLVAMWVAARRDARLGFVLAIAATLALAPIVWVHYFSLLLIPLALRERTLSWWWSLPVLMWFVNAHAMDASPTTTILVWWLALLTLYGYRRRERVGRPRLELTSSAEA